MKKVLLLAGLLAAAQNTLADESYTAKANDEGKFCARIKQQTVGANFTYRTKCRSLEEWRDRGYEVSDPVTLEPLDKQMLAQVGSKEGEA